MLRGIVELRTSPVEAIAGGGRFGPKSVRLYGMRIILSIHHVKLGRRMLWHGRLRRTSDSGPSVHEDMLVDLIDDIDDWMRRSSDHGS